MIIYCNFIQEFIGILKYEINIFVYYFFVNKCRNIFVDKEIKRIYNQINLNQKEL